MSQMIGRLFSVFFVLFFIGWLAFDMPVALGIVYEGNSLYAREIDPIFRDPPSWLQTISWFAFAYGPFYAAAAYGFVRHTSWLPYVVLPLAGMMVATTAIYMIEDATGDVQPLDWAAFYLLNGPYIVVPVLAASWLIVAGQQRVDRSPTASP
ncbi:EXPERA domain-containing protein [Rhodococcus sp. NPDC058521]|uniref:EXPERA domain-containing protein n=1 Tax=Rhodococcus sp. NPDC058521 TaxID=3346536 RepID=UPI003661DD95